MAFTKGREEHGEPPEILSGEELSRVVSDLPEVRFGRPFDNQHIDGYHTTHKWTKRSIFWELPYWKSNLIRHNLDVMHIEKNVFDNVFNTVMDFKVGSKDTPKARQDIADICKRPNLELKVQNGKTFKPPAPYALSNEKKALVLNWLKTLKLPDGYSSNIGNSVNLEEMKMQGLKSHDCHVLLDRLIPIALRGLLPDHIWVALTELSEFFRAVTSSTLRVDDMVRLEKSIVVTICKLEKIFPPAFFDSMEHLPIHLAYEARVGGPVQYRWMYPFERFLGALKRKLGNRARVEASIAEAVVIDEIVSFTSNYQDEEVQKSLAKHVRNYDGGDRESDENISVFKFPGRFLGKKPFQKRRLSQKDFDAARLFVLLNCDEVEEYIK
jgi:predicted amino acid-binding ACT domain protein